MKVASWILFFSLISLANSATAGVNFVKKSDLRSQRRAFSDFAKSKKETLKVIPKSATAAAALSNDEAPVLTTNLSIAKPFM